MAKSKKRRTRQELTHPVHASAKANDKAAERPDQPNPPGAQSPVVPYVAPTRTPDNEARYCKPDQTPPWRNILDFIALAVAGVGLWVFLGQWQAAKEANLLNGKNFRAAQRAWVGPLFKSPIFRIREQGYPIVYSFFIHNYGQTPARDSHVQIGTAIRGQTIDWNDIKRRMDNIAVTDPTESTIFNSQDLPVAGPKLPTGIPGESLDEQVKSFEDGTRHMIVYGKVWYDDIFGKPHYTTFCVIYRAHSIDPDQQTGWDGCSINTEAN